MTEWYEPLIYGDFGWAAQVIPLILIIGISWALSKKTRDMMLIQFSLCLAAKFIFPFFSAAIVVASFALLIINIVGTKGDILADVKNAALTTADAPRIIKDKVRKIKQRFKDEIAPQIVVGDRK